MVLLVFGVDLFLRRNAGVRLHLDLPLPLTPILSLTGCASTSTFFYRPYLSP